MSLHVFVRLSFFFVPLVTEKVVKSSKKKFWPANSGRSTRLLVKIHNKSQFKTTTALGSISFPLGIFHRDSCLCPTPTPKFYATKSFSKVGRYTLRYAPKFIKLTSVLYLLILQSFPLTSVYYSLIKLILKVFSINFIRF